MLSFFVMNEINFLPSRLPTCRPVLWKSRKSSFIICAMPIVSFTYPRIICILHIIIAQKIVFIYVGIFFSLLHVRKKKREAISKRHSFIACAKTLHHFIFRCDFIKLYLTFSICHLSLFHLVEHILRYTPRISPERWAATRQRDSQIRSKQSKVWRSTVLCCTIFFLYMEVCEKRFALFCRQICSTRVWEWKWYRLSDIQHLRFAIVQNYSFESSSHFNHIPRRAFLSCDSIWTNLLVVCSFTAWSVDTSPARRK